MKSALIILLSFFTLHLCGQPLTYSTANVHSHNDYEQKTPFWLAYNAGLGSMEADIFLRNGELLVAHTEKELVNHRTLEAYYLRNLQQCIEKNNGYPYADPLKKLQLLIDIKTDSVTTLDKLIEVLRKYPALINNPSLRFVITGQRPPASRFTSYPAFIYFDAVLSESYPDEALSKIVLFSDNFKTFAHWNGQGTVPAAEWAVLEAAVARAHHLKKPVRFWNAPDFINAWVQFERLGVDYINTDHIEAISAFLENLPKNGVGNP
jgi:alkaline phosphatase